jgi:predicted nucleotidyltransferase
MTLIHKNTDLIFKLCEEYKVKELYAFGSVLSDSFSAESDVDFIVSFLPLDLLDYADNYFDFKFALEEALNRPVDLLEETAIKNPYFKDSVNRKKKLVYEIRSKNMAL